MNLSLKDKEWKEFLFPEIFLIKGGFYNKKPKSSQEGTIPFLGATASNNGITKFYKLSEIENGSKLGFGKNDPIESKIFKGNCIAVTNNGSVGYAYYQTCDFTCSHDINPLYLKKHHLNLYIAYFLIAAIEKQKVCFEYARKWRPIRMKKSKILLPVTNEGEPDYNFMEQYIRQKERVKSDSYISFIQKRLSKLNNTSIIPLSEKEWGEFFIEDVAKIQSGERLTKADMVKGNIPFVGATDSNNGVTEYVSNINSSVDRNILGVNYNGSVVENFYHPYKAVFSDDVKRLSLKRHIGNKYLYLFLKVIILQQKSKYQYGYKFNGQRMIRQKIMLPIDSKGNPDYEYMEQYMKNIEYTKLKTYIDYKN